ncbi:MAG: accessory Sec system glycosyltransferase GtfA [Lactobacillus crispatus]|jgi:accessory Sec system glycosylation protein GtfA|uniref:accessory Sec system glycosyltransferase GtfA n=1 Tax=Lactobacillus crispatus TaxID=47770 RepID=UPI0018A9AEFC|nr:accessory Sec system glycosyltransferase GtfA [Lactobacillus crispatus]MCH4003981.1 accessory Sec system glycosyltransferase GtfA [Lactobacillus crispatus]MCI1336058.1 accessory Sec system glycosyltransferase GtfA [Lactobacillus crispatus]MCI1365548.1 accessory Sec system glycosyltransferase GtfA [Lactobacillus crispatus]MCI1494506.1 accessory Sec system glycosyltransferase GtfA [Lactobacillus crispatus]MCI1538240.1 accessory Sec system glycosyltransferase GtfA [Lactobacillus crispatus]
MTVYSVNLGLGWASSGVEYAQKYRAESFRRKGIPAKFIFSDLILGNNIEDLTKNMGFEDDQIIWLYNFFTDIKIAPSDFSLTQLLQDLSMNKRTVAGVDKVSSNEVAYNLPQEHLSIRVRLHDPAKKTIDQVTYLNDGKISKRDFYSYTKYASEYYSADSQAVLREFYNEDGSVAYVEHLDGDKEIFEFPDNQVFYSKNDLYREMIRRLHLTKNDLILMDREDEQDNLTNGQIIFENHGPAKIVVIIHADHYDKHYTNKHHILWNNFYEYQFTHAENVASFVTATQVQKELFQRQEEEYYHVEPRIDCIPVGCLEKLTRPEKSRKPYSLITASRLASEKHVDWIVKAVIEAKKEVPELNLDIYGEGSKRDLLQKIITEKNAEDYIHLMGQKNLDKVYCNYSAYIAASTSEGFGLSLLEAVGSGLPMIGYDVPYGNPTFIDDSENGYLISYNEEWSEQEKIAKLRDAIVAMFTKADLKQFEQHSYEIAEPYLLENIADKWQKLVGDLTDD